MDKAKRAAMYGQIQDIYMKAAPIMFLYETPYAVGLRKSVQGYVQIPLGNNVFLRTHIER